MTMHVVLSLSGVGATTGVIFGQVAQVMPSTTTAVKIGQELGSLPATCILGVVAVASVAGLVYLYKDKTTTEKEDKEKLYKLIEEGTKSAQAQTEVLRGQAGVLVEVKDAIKGCLKNGH